MSKTRNRPGQAPPPSREPSRLTQFLTFLKKYQQIMLVPHSGKKLHTFRISNRTLLLTLFVFVFLVLFSIMSLNSHETRTAEIENLSYRSTHSKQHIRIFSGYSRTLERSFTPLFEEAARLSRNVGGINVIRDHINPVIFSNHSHIKDVRNDIARYATVGNRLVGVLRQISSTYDFVRNYRETVRQTPSIWPVGGIGYITSPFGVRRSPFTGLWQHHTGVDIAYWPGTPILATADGVVEGASYMGGYGLCVVIRHQYGFRTRYGHMSALRVSVEQAVSQGQIIGTMGSTGLSTGFHLHYEVILNNKFLDPAPYLMNRVSL